MTTKFKYSPLGRVIFKLTDYGQYELCEEIFWTEAEELDNLIFRSRCKGEWMGCQLIRVRDGDTVSYRHYSPSLYTDISAPFVSIIFEGKQRNITVGAMFEYYDECANICKIDMSLTEDQLDFESIHE